MPEPERALIRTLRNQTVLAFIQSVSGLSGAGGHEGPAACGADILPK